MLCWSKPSIGDITAFLATQREQKFSYACVGGSRQDPPEGFTVDHNRARLGHGVETFERAKRAVKQWKMFDMPWVHLYWPGTPIEVGMAVGVVISHFGFWSMNASRIVYVIDDQGSPQQFGFAYGTLPGHEEIGEERFLVQFNKADESVWYDLFAFSRPGTWARLAYPVSRALRKRFVRDSKLAMARAVKEDLDGASLPGNGSGRRKP
jgi:uncharacterized protein (UPF0548 family)